jgi:hypothetical protein
MQDTAMILKFVMANAMLLVLLGLAIFYVVILVRIQRAPDNFDLRSVIADDKGQPSVHKIGQLTALLLSTWLLVYLAIHGQMTEGYFGTYMGIWAAAQAADKWIGGRNIPPPPVPSPEQ